MASEHEAAKGALSKPEEKQPAKKEVHVKELDHGYHVEKTHEDGSKTEHAATDGDDMLDHVIDHFHDMYNSAKEKVGNAIDTAKHLNPYQEAADALDQYKGGQK